MYATHTVFIVMLSSSIFGRICPKFNHVRPKYLFFSLLQIIMPLYKLTSMCLIWSIDEPKLNAHKQNTDYNRMLDVLQWTPKTICGQNYILLVHVYWEIGLNEYIKPYDQAIACQCIFIFRVMFVSITICLML